MKRPFAAYQGQEPYVFVCYAHEDAGHVYPEIQRLHERGVRIWYDEGISPGTRWSDELARALGKASLVLFYCTPQSVKSKHCQDEVNFALGEERPLLVVQESPVDLPPGMQLQLGAQQSILKYELSDERYADKLIAAVDRHLVSGPPPAPATKSTRSRTRGPLLYVIVVGVVIGLTVLLWRVWPLSTSGPHTVGSPSASVNMEYTVAVLPFRALSSERATVTFAKGLTDELVNELSGPMPAKVRSMFPALLYALRVVPARSTLRYRDATEDLAAISRTLGAAYLVEGSVRSAGDQVRVNLQLIHAADNEPVWSHSYDASADAPLQAQSDVARRAARRIASMVPDTYREIRSAFANSAAYDYHVRGNREEMDMLAGGDVDVPAMLANLEKSLELDPTHVWSYQNLVMAYLWSMAASMEAVRTVAPIGELLTRAIAVIDSGVPTFGLTPSAFVGQRAQYSLHTLDYGETSEYVRDVLSVNPNATGALNTQSLLLLHQERPDEALASVRRAMDSAPGIPWTHVRLAQLLRVRGQSAASVKAIEGAFEFYPGELGKAQLLLEQANAYVALGKPERATTLVDQAWDLCGTNHPDLFPAALATTGRTDRARAILNDLEAAGPGRRFSPVDMIEGYVALGDLDAAFRWIDRAVDARFEPAVRWMRLVTVSVAGVWPTVLTTDPRWQQAYAKLPKVEAV